uniref:Reverse transcriptase domain-containing protein n=1 Tax=Tanacetum cinerariifolium TaxID=118510 RepID=A0A6L2LYA9_TANCI|nr:reverse transcriptase domain-containing protein [Tanacetum cinerariifolium]
MVDRTMEELLQATTEGYREAIIILEILDENFEIKMNLLQEAWDRFKEMLRACPHHGFSELTQIDTFYNGLTEQDQDSLNAAAGGNLLNKTTREALKIIENKSKISNLVEIVNKQVIAPAKAVGKTCVPVEKLMLITIALLLIAIILVFVQKLDLSIKCLRQTKLVTKFHHPILLRNIVPNPKGEMKAVTTRSGLAYEGPSIPTESPLEKVDEQNTEEILDKEHSNCSGSTAQVQPPVVAI